MNTVEEFSKLILFLLLGILLLHIITQNSGQSWLASKFTTKAVT